MNIKNDWRTILQKIRKFYTIIVVDIYDNRDLWKFTKLWIEGKEKVNIIESDNQFYIGETAENPSAQIEFEISEDILTILSTEVSASLQGQGVGQQLVAYAVDYARNHQLKIIPVCPYAIKQFEKHPEYIDVKVN